MHLSVVLEAFLCGLAVAAGANSPGASVSQNKVLSVNKKGSQSVSGSARSKPVVYNQATDRRNRKHLGVFGRSKTNPSAKGRTKTAKGTKTVKTFASKDFRAMNSDVEGRRGSLSVLPTGSGNVARMTAAKSGGRRLSPGTANTDRNARTASYKGKNVNTRLNRGPKNSAKPGELGQINLEGHPNNPFSYEVVCPPVRTRLTECSEQLVGRDGTKYACTVTSGTTRVTTCRKNSNKGVGSQVDADGNAEIRFRGLSFSKSKCVQARGTGKNYECSVSKGLLKSGANKIRATSTRRCEGAGGKGGKSVKISNVRYQRKGGSGGGSMSYNLNDCFIVSGNLRFDGYRPSELKGIVNRLGIQFHAMVTPVGKFVCADKAVCPKLGAQPECYYCNACQGNWDRKSLAAGIQMEEACSQDASRKARFQMEFCPPPDIQEKICSGFKGGLANQLSQKGDIDTRIEVYEMAKAPPSDAELSRQYRDLNNLKKLLLTPQATAVALAAGRRSPTPADKEYVFRANELKGQLIGCSHAILDYGAGASGKALNLVASAKTLSKKGGFTDFLVGNSAKCPSS